jgi:hypothetical protein
MIYLPKRAVFIHIPRTGGNSITNAIASSCVGKKIDIVLGTCHWSIKDFYHVSLHVPAKHLKKHIKEWDSIFKFAIHRPLEDRIESVIKLITQEKKRKNRSKNTNEIWQKLVDSDNYEETIRQQWKSHTTEWFTLGEKNEDLGVRIYNYNELHRSWPEICANCNIPYSKLLHLNKS